MSSDIATKPSTDRRGQIDGSDARLILGVDEAALIRLSREKRGEAEPEDLSKKSTGDRLPQVASDDRVREAAQCVSQGRPDQTRADATRENQTIPESRTCGVSPECSTRRHHPYAASWRNFAIKPMWHLPYVSNFYCQASMLAEVSIVFGFLVSVSCTLDELRI
jgi:hypothetical protein